METAHNPSSLLTRRFYLVLVLWLTTIVLIGYFGWGRVVPPDGRAVVVILGIALPVLLYHRLASLRAFLDNVPDAIIVAFHGWRVLAGFVFLSYGAQGGLPTVFANNAGYGDIFVGLLVPVILALPESRRKYIGFHLFGLADFVVAVGTGLYFTLIRDPLQTNLFTSGIVVIPWYGVALSGASHLIALSRLTRVRKSSPSIA